MKLDMNIREVIGHFGALFSSIFMFHMAQTTGRNIIVGLLAALITYVFVYFTRLLWIFIAWACLMIYIVSLIR